MSSYVSARHKKAALKLYVDALLALGTTADVH
jgi:hypothetical protein